MDNTDESNELKEEEEFEINEGKLKEQFVLQAQPHQSKPSLRSEILLRKFEDLKQKSEKMRHMSQLRQLKTEKRRAKRLVKKALKDPSIRNLVQNKGKDSTTNSESDSEKPKESWQDVKPFLTVNDHLQGPISHDSCGPKTELETIIDDAIAEGDLEKAEILSDTLANREFAVKITKAFAAKRYAEKQAEEEEQRKAKRQNKCYWMFEAKEKWQMKGNM